LDSFPKKNKKDLERFIKASEREENLFDIAQKNPDFILKNRILEEFPTLLIDFNSLVSVSRIELFNNKTNAARNAKEIEILIDKRIIFSGFIQKPGLVQHSSVSTVIDFAPNLPRNSSI
jgi:hypothetical protein